MSVHHAVVWLDHAEAKVFKFDGENVAETAVRSHPTSRTHDRHASGRHTEDHAYYHSIATALADAAEVLVVGPSTAKLEFIRHVHRHDAALEARVIGVETVDHPTDGQLVAHARKYFIKADRMR